MQEASFLNVGEEDKPTECTKPKEKKIRRSLNILNRRGRWVAWHLNNF